MSRSSVFQLLRQASGDLGIDDENAESGSAGCPPVLLQIVAPFVSLIVIRWVPARVLTLIALVVERICWIGRTPPAAGESAVQNVSLMFVPFTRMSKCSLNAIDVGTDFRLQGAP